MQQKLLRKAGLLSILLTIVGSMLTSCINEPDPTTPPPMTSMVRFVNAIPDGGKMDVWVDGTVVSAGLSYKDVTPYLTIHAGDRFIRLTNAGEDTSKAIFRGEFTIRSLTMITSVFRGWLTPPSNVQFWITQERFVYSDETVNLVDSADVKLINASIEAPTAKLVEGTKTLIDQTKYKDANSNQWWLSSYVRIKTGSHDFTVVDGNSVTLTPFTFDLVAKHRYTFVVMGTNATPDVLRLTDDVTQYPH
jgi:hypothetical protein